MNYTDIYNIIAKYYPIGIDINDPSYQAYEGSQLLKEKIGEILHSDESKSRWKQIFTNIYCDFPDLLAVTTDAPPISICYSAELLISDQKIHNIIYTQKLYCHLSYLGPFFCIYGKDEIALETDNGITRFDPIITISPTGKFENYSLILRRKIERNYPGFVYLPFYWLDKRVKSLRIVSSDLKEYQYSSVFQALFTRENITDYKIQGNKLYK